MIALFNNLYINIRFFLVAGVLIALFVTAFPFPFLLPVAKTALVVFLAVIIFDGLVLFNKNVHFRCERSLPNIMSLGSENRVTITLKSESAIAVKAVLIDELPYQLQARNNQHEFKLGPKEEHQIKEVVRPINRGEYHFGRIRLFIRSNVSLLERRISFNLQKMVPVYPSILDVKKYELRASSQLSNFLGIKKLRRIGQSYEFEQIREYNQGDNYQRMNWKATGKVGQLMVNEYTDEKAQPIYCFIDKSRYMKMPFNGMSLLDYAINASLIISNSALKRDDKAGLLTFSDKVETLIKADNKRNQLSKILQTLYREDETRIEANYELMYSQMRKTITSRSLIFLFSNFDTVYSLERVLPLLRRMNMIHLLVVIVFENTELEEFRKKKAENVLDIYDQTIAQKISLEKRQVLNQLQQHAIQVIYTKPEGLSLNALNKYLELKSRGMI